MHQVSVKDFPDLNLGDIRRNERFVSIINNVSSNPGSSIPGQNAGWYSTKATYEFYKNEDVSIQALEQIISNYGSSQVAGADKVLVAHDFCQISYKDSAAEGLGYLANKEAKGIIAYNSIAVSTTGMPLSLLYQHSFVRKFEELGKSKKRSYTPFEDKESYHWYKGITTVNGLLGNSVHKIHIADREADIYELFFCAYEENTDLLIRAKHNRTLNDKSLLWDAVAAEPLAAKTTLNIPDKTGKKTAAIEVEIRYHQIEILRPKGSSNQYESVSMSAIELKQISAKQDWQEEVLYWKLLTTLPVNTVPEALQCVKWYCYRWLIERFHYVLKSGTQIEELQLKKASSLQKAIHLYSISAMRMMQLVYQSRQTPDVNCELVLTKDQWIVLYMLIHKVPKATDQPPTLAEAATWIGKLGGHLGRKSDGPPGLKAVWIGYRRLIDAVKTYQILNQQNLGKG
jgi:hypothetical protein